MRGAPLADAGLHGCSLVMFWTQLKLDGSSSAPGAMRFMNVLLPVHALIRIERALLCLPAQLQLLDASCTSSLTWL